VNKFEDSESLPPLNNKLALAIAGWRDPYDFGSGTDFVQILGLGSIDASVFLYNDADWTLVTHRLFDGL
jgi:hypothetical protein